MKITREDVLRVAELAHLELTPEEVELYRAQLDEILTYIGKLEQLDTEKVEPMAQVIFATAHSAGSAEPAAGAVRAGMEIDAARPVLRADVLRPCNDGEAILAQAPDAKPPFFRVPQVIGRES